MTNEGALCDLNFTVCAVTKALGSVSQACRVAIEWCFIFHGAQKDFT